MSPKIYVYKLVADNGGAPCIWRGLLSLAICKPKIRKVAKKHSLIFGFGGKGRYFGRLIYVAKVTAKPGTGDYYHNPKYANRPDCIYHEIAGETRRKRTARYHNKTDERKKDVGLNFENAFVLLSEDFRYFGKKGTSDYKRDFPTIKKLIEGLNQNHRVNHSVQLRKELIALKRQLWRRYARKVLGSPSDSNESHICNRESPSCTVK